MIAGGCDGFCQFTNAGFSALSAVSPEPCTPFAAGRKGINLGEGGALVAMTRHYSDAFLAYRGAGLTTDAHHLSAPEPEGIQAAQAMRLALESAGLCPADIDLVIAHGTGTPLNDSMEAKAIERVFGTDVPCASYKSLFGTHSGRRRGPSGRHCRRSFNGQSRRCVAAECRNRNSRSYACAGSCAHADSCPWSGDSSHRCKRLCFRRLQR